MLRIQEWRKQPDGQPRTRPKFPPKLLRPRRDPEAVTSTESGEPLGWGRRVKQAPGHQPQGQCGARPRGQTAGARPLPQPGGGAAPGTQPLPTPPRGAEPGTRGSLSLGFPSSRRGLASSPGRTAFAPGPPTQEQAARPGAGRRLPAPFRPQLAASTRSCVLFIPAPHHQELPTTSLPCFATSQTDRQETQREKGERGEKKTTAPPAPILQPGAEREEEGEHVFPPPLHPDSATPADRAARSPEAAEREEVRLKRQKPGASERARARERKKYIYSTKPR